VKPLYAPLVTGLAAGVAAWHWAFHPTFADAAAVAAFGGTVASISTTMLGFILAALAVLASITQTHLVKQMQVYGHYSDLLRTMLTDSLFFMTCALCGFAILFGVQAKEWLLSLILGLHVAAFVSLIDVGRKLWFVLVNLRAS